MAGARLCGDSNSAALLQGHKFSSPPDILESPLTPNSSSPLHGEAINDRLVFRHAGKEEDIDEDWILVNPQSKKRRLTARQVQVLERNFESENKLDPERKLELARELGLQPRQVAIWFQNRRARFKTKQLEKDCGSLRASYEKLKADYDSLQKENETLKNQILCLKEKLHAREEGERNVEPLHAIDPPLENDLDIENLCVGPASGSNKLEDVMSSGRSDVFDSESPRIVPAGSSNCDQSDEEDQPSKILLDRLCWFSQPNSYDLGFSVDEQTYWPLF